MQHLCGFRYRLSEAFSLCCGIHKIPEVLCSSKEEPIEGCNWNFLQPNRIEAPASSSLSFLSSEEEQDLFLMLPFPCMPHELSLGLWRHTACCSATNQPCDLGPQFPHLLNEVNIRKAFVTVLTHHWTLTIIFSIFFYHILLLPCWPHLPGIFPFS